MKTTFKLFFLFLLLIPCSIKALYAFDNTTAINKNNEVIQKYISYDKYLINNKNGNVEIPFLYNNGVNSYAYPYNNSGFLNKEELIIAGGKNSYMFSIRESYWMMDKYSSSQTYQVDNNDNGYSYISNSVSSGVRNTQFIKKNAKIDGVGTYKNPWVFAFYDNDKPIITFNPAGTTKYTNSVNVEIKVFDESSEVLHGQTIKYRWQKEENCSDKEIDYNLSVPLSNTDDDVYSTDASVISPLVSGKYYLCIYSGISDVMDNKTDINRSFAYSLDNVGPTISFTNRSTTDSSISFNINASDELSGIPDNPIYYHSLISKDKDCKNTNYTSTTNNSIKYDNLSIGRYKVCVYTFDKAGNKSDYFSYEPNVSMELFKLITTVETAYADDKNSIFVNNSNAGINFAARNSDTNGKGLYYINNELYSDGSNRIYYYRGDVNNNNIIFGNFCWKIVRTTQKNGVKLIYNGIPVDGKCSTKEGESTGIGMYSFNSTIHTNTYVGYMFSNACDTISNCQINISNSTAKSVIENWYANNMTHYNAYMDIDAGYCNDRGVGSGSGINSDYTVYNSGIRLGSNMRPSLSCSNSNDLFTYSSSTIGNKKLSYPVALLTADEVVFAGALLGPSDNKSFYLYNGVWTWTMSPYGFYQNSNARELRLSEFGALNFYGGTNDLLLLRPVVAVKGITKVIRGTGTIDSPYVIE